MSKTPVLTTVEQIRNLKASLRAFRAKVRSLERQNARLLADEPLAVSEAEVTRLETRCEELTQLLELAEAEVISLRRQNGRVA